MADANVATEVKQAKRRLRTDGIPEPAPAFAALPTISTHKVADKTANLVSETTALDGTIIRHYS